MREIGYMVNGFLVETKINHVNNAVKSYSTEDFFDFSNTRVSDVVESGFKEGGKIKKTHITIERNYKLREFFFQSNPTCICDLCAIDTSKTYPWTKRILDIHHLLPLSSGTRTEAKGTTLNDLVPVCPSCHRAIHRYYDKWLDENYRVDFCSAHEAEKVYRDLKSNFKGSIYA
jgi:predicted HNH restriction endonuclease